MIFVQIICRHDFEQRKMKLKCILILALIALLVAPINSSNILVFIPSPWKSHLVSFFPLFLELAHRGHNVTVVTKFAIENPPANYHQVIVHYEMDFIASKI